MYDFVAIDFETANHNMNSACSLVIVAVKDLKIVSREYYLIKPPTEQFSADNIKIHGISFDDVKDSEQFSEIWNKISHYFNNVMIAHNAQFDFSVLYNLLDTYNLECNDFLYLDSKSIANRVCNCGLGLSDIADYLSIEIDNHHNALSDAEACANIVIKCIELNKFPSFLYYAMLQGYNFTKSFSNINATKVFRTEKFKDFNRIKISDLTATTSEFNKQHPFYMKSIVLTGELENCERKEAMQKIVDVGGIVKSSVSSKTDYLVVGKQDKTLVGEDGLSSKEEKAYALIKDGSKIKILNESEFLNYLK